MEDKWTKKKSQEIEETKSDAIASALSSIYKKALNEEDLQIQREDASYYRKLARPRSVKYLELVAEEMRIAERLGELYRLLEKQNVATASAGDKPQVPTAPAGDEPHKPNTYGQGDAEEGEQSEPRQGQATEWWQMDVEKKQQEESVDNSAILAEIAQLKAELKDVRTALEAEMPVGHGRLGMIYPSDKEGRLIYLGAIAGPGTPFSSTEELLNQRKPQTEQEKQQWIKGYDAYKAVRGECLVVEIYLTAICVVFEDGSVKCYRD